MKPSKTQIAKALGITPSCLSRNIARGCPVFSIEAAHAWRSQHIRPRVSAHAASFATETSTQPVTAGEALMSARTAEALVRVRKAESELARSEGRTVDAAALASALRAWRATFGTTAASFGVRIEQRVRAAVGDSQATSMRLRALVIDSELSLENVLMAGFLDQLRVHMPVLARQIDAHLEDQK